MRFKLIVLIAYTLSIGNLFYKIGFHNGTNDERTVGTEIVIRTNKLSYQEGCELAMQYNCYVNTCDNKPIELLKEYCYQSAKTFSK